MPHVNVTIAGKSYRMACGPGEEDHLAALAKSFDDRVSEMRGTFGEIGDMRLHVMAALTLADELQEARGRIADLEARAAQGAAEQARLAGGVGAAAERIDRLARALSGHPAGQGQG
ncbi:MULTISPECIES: cell division protein ZapA [unclassified Methylobacterium]|uniref:cell division protein ZapA n=1 Tax=unclassified Methylobacterium TaxID=2615210 RepID=UPI000D767AFC|nr:cell division protein ZapA [Methylobacterium sp. B4]PXW63694.1 cell division protein ZapA [Methylobacterium sp. B4]